MRCNEEFIKLYKRDSVNVSFCPYRICPMGAHLDPQYGKITAFVIDKGVRIVCSGGLS